MNSALSFFKALKTVMISRMVPAAQAWVKNASLKGDHVFTCFLSLLLLKKVILLFLVVRAVLNPSNGTRKVGWHP